MLLEPCLASIANPPPSTHAHLHACDGLNGLIAAKLPSLFGGGLELKDHLVDVVCCLGHCSECVFLRVPTQAFVGAAPTSRWCSFVIDNDPLAVVERRAVIVEVGHPRGTAVGDLPSVVAIVVTQLDANVPVLMHQCFSVETRARTSRAACRTVCQKRDEKRACLLPAKTASLVTPES
jgi:hypothetical protein